MAAHQVVSLPGANAFFADCTAEGEGLAAFPQLSCGCWPSSAVLEIAIELREWLVFAILQVAESSWMAASSSRRASWNSNPVLA